MVLTGVQLVKNILKIAGPLPQKKLQKLTYLAEIEYIEKYGERLSDLSFVHYYYGPFSADIMNIEDEDENITLINKNKGRYAVKESSIINPEEVDKLDPEIEGFLKEVLHKYMDKTGKDLEKIADSTEPFEEAENLKDTIDLDGYAKYWALISDERFIKLVELKDAENIKKKEQRNTGI